MVWGELLVNDRVPPISHEHLCSLSYDVRLSFLYGTGLLRFVMYEISFFG